MTSPASAGTGEPAPGASFGRFTTSGVLGRGATGVVLAGFDPELDRKVAIKILYSAYGDPDGRDRLQREAQAMARLSHPNAVTVYDVGRSGDRLFVAMELVDGQTLRGWLEKPRDWREIVAMFVAAGRGLQAAHRAGLVHRDFKPENVLIGRDGRPRVSDFGLATATLGDDPAPISAARVGASLTVRGIAVGTPAYMSPEQWRGATLDARTDQFAFCVALWTAVWGTRPFAGETSQELRSAVLAGRVGAPPARRGVPRWLEPMLRRGLEVDSSRRWPTLGRLLDELDRRRSRRWRIWALGGATAAAGAAISFGVMAASARAPECDPPRERMDALWGPARRGALDHHLAVLAGDVGSKRFAAAAAMIDSDLAGWSALHVSACRATRDGQQSPQLLDLRMRCLERWSDRLDAAIGGLEHSSDGKTLEAAIRAISDVGPLEMCSDAAALEAEVPPPALPAARAEADAIAHEVQAIAMARSVEKTDRLMARADAAVARARTLDHAPTLALALQVRTRLAMDTDDAPGVVAALHDEIEAASRAHADRHAAQAWGMLVRAVGLNQGHRDEARALMPAARAAAARAGDDPLLRAEVAMYEADVLGAFGDTRGALADLGDAQHILETAGAAQRGSPLGPLLARVLHSAGVAHEVADELDAATAAMREALALDDRAYGPDTLESASGYLALAQIDRDQLNFKDAERAAREAVRIREARTGESPSLALALIGLADILGKAGHPDAGVPIGERAARIARATMSADSIQRALVIELLAEEYDMANDAVRALALFDEALATAERTRTVTRNVAAWLINRAEIARRLGRCREAIPGYRKAAEVGAQLEGPESHYIGTALRGEGACQHNLGHDADAIAALDKSLAYKPYQAVAEFAVVCRGLLGTLLVDTGRDPARGLQLARDAMTELTRTGSKDPFVPALGAWVQRHRGAGR